jgi:hypothetical protein
MTHEGHPLQPPPSELDLSMPGAREERLKLKRFHARLNDAEVVPEQAYRMAGQLFPLVCFVNNIAGLWASKNYEVIPIFIARAHAHMSRYPAGPAATAYYDLLSRYLGQMAFVLKSFSALSAESLELIPEAVLNAGPQEAPPSEA